MWCGFKNHLAISFTTTIIYAKEKLLNDSFEILLEVKMLVINLEKSEIMSPAADTHTLLKIVFKKSKTYFGKDKKYNLKEF